MTILRPMRLFLRHAALFSFALSLAFFCSCERHRAEELPAEEEHEKSGAPDAHDRGPAMGTHEHGKAEHAASPAAATPAEFFPAASASPH